ncbi:baseplate J family protein [Roseibium sp. TrichSKD4]|uniref:baseplate J/gp47 family protein n=1 Tax=Roseibium sp. TrichSKD4 TaxID=744980 RepID=UPI0001E56F4D|nr:baseplate J/gp47 family protein [Roseibium sp. TrichSKD4]EFO31336.1 baseplate J family protein [Roseibium sp. TrichSKD4]
MGKLEIIPEKDPETLFQEIMDDYVGFRPEFEEVRHLDSTPEAKANQALAMREYHDIARTNTVWRSYLIDYSNGAPLDALGKFYDAVRLPGEDDDRFQARVKLEISGRSGGGPLDAYKALVMGISLDVRDVVIWREGRDPTINVAVLSAIGSGDASPELLGQVRSKLDDLGPGSETVLSDRFNVMSAVRKSGAVHLLARVSQNVPAEISETLRAIILEKWVASDLLGKSLTPGWIVATAMSVAGLMDARLVTPLDGIEASPNEAIEISDLKVTIERV